MTDKRWKDHAEFLGELADRVTWLAIAQGEDKIVAVNAYTRWLSEKCFLHAQKHILEDFGKVADGTPVDNISISGDRVKREPLKLYPDTPEVKREGPSWDKDKKGWDMAKREPHVYADADSVKDDDSEIKTQEECAKRFSEGQAVCRNYAGIND